ncbi:hypothetical protein HP532_05460 [Pseudomonas sp. CrR25]|nr:hypothetical protein [Pseudomonas sp. CrR25]
MNPAPVQIVALQQHGRPLWQVRWGRRALNFHEELAARSFAAQLHLRLGWLQQQTSPGNGDSPPS